MHLRWSFQTLHFRCFSTDRPELRARVLKFMEASLTDSMPATPKRAGLPCTMDILLRGLSIPLLDGYLKFCISASHSLNSPTQKGALPNRIQKWSVLSSPHVHKTAWTQLERREYRRVFSVYGMHPEVVPKFLWYVEQHAPPDIKLECQIHEYIPVKP